MKRPILANRLFLSDQDVNEVTLERFRHRWTKWYKEEEIGDDGLLVMKDGKPKLIKKHTDYVIDGNRHLLTGFGNDYIGLPRGDVRSLGKLARHAIDIRGVNPLSFDLKLNKETMEDPRWVKYQNGCVTDWTETGSGLVIADTGAGKTVIGIDAACRMNLRTLILAAKKEVEPHWVPEFRFHTNIDKLEKKLKRKLIGKFNTKSKEQFPISVSTIQTFLHPNNYPALIRHQNDFGLIICDEIQELVAEQFFRLISCWNPLCWLGLTATPNRNDQREQLAYWHLGPIRATAEVGQMKPVVYFHDDGFKTPSYLVSGNKPYSSRWKWKKIHDHLHADEQRYNRIVEKVMEDIDDGRLVAVIGLRLNFVRKVRDMLRKEGYKVAYVDGSVPIKKRPEIYNEVAKGVKYRCLCAGKVLKSMVSIKPLDCMHIITPINDEITMKQFFGRTRRPDEGKPFPIIRVWAGEGGQVSGAAKNLRKYCEAEGWEVNDVGFYSGLHAAMSPWRKKK